MSLTPIECFKGTKKKHPTTRCICDCGKERIVRTTKLRLGLVTMCGSCAKKEASKRGGKTRRKLSDEERLTNFRYGIYKQNAKRKEMEFDIPLQLFSGLIEQECIYCGTDTRIGVDRIDSSLGYTPSNCAPCCSDCNYAKREMSTDDFLNLVARIYAYQSR